MALSGGDGKGCFGAVQEDDGGRRIDSREGMTYYANIHCRRVQRKPSAYYRAFAMLLGTFIFLMDPSVKQCRVGVCDQKDVAGEPESLLLPLGSRLRRCAGTPDAVWP